ncbi:MAG: YkgJ family cysteine cluster protein [Candidatus Woesearchaeota archaeon]
MLSKNDSLKKVLSLSNPCSCGSCNHGCKMGSGWLIEDDIPKIASFLNVSIENLKKDYLEKHKILNKWMWRPKILCKNKPYGKCIFFKNEKCSIHPVKPLECKVAMPCKEYGEKLTIWFMLNYVLDLNNDQSVKDYLLYLKSGGKTLPGGEPEKLISKKRLSVIKNMYNLNNIKF